MTTITRLARFIAGLPRDVDISTNSLQVASLFVGSASPVELTKAMTALLNTINTTGITAANINANVAGKGLTYALGETDFTTYYNNGNETESTTAVDMGYGSTFIAPVSSPISTVTFQAISPDMGNWDFVCKLYSFGLDNKPNALLATSNTLSVVSLPTANPAQDLTFTFSSPFTATATTRYYAVVLVTAVGTGTQVDFSARTTSEAPEWGVSTTDGSTWSTPAATDRVRFKVIFNLGLSPSLAVLPNGASLNVTTSGVKIADGGVINTALASSAKQSVLESKLAALRDAVLGFAPTTGNTSDVVTTQVSSVATTATPIGAGAPVGSANALGIFVGTVSGSSDIGKVLIRVHGTDNGFDDGTGDEIYGVLSYAGSDFTLSYKTAAGIPYTILSTDTTAKFDFYFVEVMDLYSFGVDKMLMWAVSGVIDASASDAIYTEISARQNADSTLQANIDSEITSRTNSDITLQSNINLEITSRKNADSTLQANLNSEITSRTNADSTLQANIDSEASSRAQADSLLQSNLNSEITSRTNSDITLQANIDAEASSRITADSTLQANINAEATSRASADSTLTANLNSEITSRTNSDVTLQVNIDAEASSRITADSTLQANINAEATSRALADSTLTANLNSEITSRTNADSTLQANITSEASSRLDSDSSLQANINSEASSRISSDSSLQANLNSEITSRTNSDSTLQANINSEFSSRVSSDSSLQANINSEATARMVADSSLQSQIGALNVEVVDVQYTAGYNVTAGDVVILSTTDVGKVLQADSSALATCTWVVGVATQTKTSGQLVMVRTWGEATVTTDGTNFTLGQRVYVGATGQASITPPATLDNVVYLLGGATNTNKVFVNPNLEYVVM